MKHKDLESIKEKTKALYSGLGWVSLFTKIRFWTGSFVQLEKIIPEEGRILDLGCGYGIFANYLALCSPKRNIVGVDMDKKKIKYAGHGVKNTSFSIGDATQMKFKDLNCIILHDVLHHLESYDQQKELIKNCRKMLYEKGMLLIVEVDKNPFWKLILGRLTDFIMYKGESVKYRYKKEMVNMLKNYFSSIQIKKLKNNPFSQIVYICQKI